MSVNSEMTGLGNEVRKLSGLSKLLSIPEMREALHNVKLGITPIGDIEINENGEFDVTEYSNAIVNVVGSGESENLRVWNITLTSAQRTRFVLLTDDWIAKHRTDSNLMIVVFNNPAEAFTSISHYVYVMKYGSPLTKNANGSVTYGLNCRLGTSSSSGATPTILNNPFSSTSTSVAGDIQISGNELRLTANISYGFKPATYTAVAVLI